MAIDVADVVSQFGAYYKPGSDNQKNLRNRIYQAVETAQFFGTRPTEDTIWRGTYSSMTRVIQPFQKAFTPIGAVSFKPNEFPLYKLKIDAEETPDDLEASYLGFLTTVDDIDRAKWPFVRWFIENHIMPRKEEDLELNEYFSGVYAAPAPGTAGAQGTSLNGLKKTIQGYNTGGRTNLGNGAIATGALATDKIEFCTQIEEFANSIPALIRKKIDYIFMSVDLELRYKQGKRAKYNDKYAQSKDLFGIEDYPNIQVKGLTSHDGSDLIWASPAMNRIRPVKKASLGDTLKIESNKRVVSVFTDWHEAINFEVPEYIFHNDQELA